MSEPRHIGSIIDDLMADLGLGPIDLPPADELASLDDDGVETFASARAAASCVRQYRDRDKDSRD